MCRKWSTGCPTSLWWPLSDSSSSLRWDPVRYPGWLPRSFSPRDPGPVPWLLRCWSTGWPTLWSALVSPAWRWVKRAELSFSTMLVVFGCDILFTFYRLPWRTTRSCRSACSWPSSGYSRTRRCPRRRTRRSRRSWPSSGTTMAGMCPCTSSFFAQILHTNHGNMSNSYPAHNLNSTFLTDTRNANYKYYKIQYRIFVLCPWLPLLGSLLCGLHSQTDPVNHFPRIGSGIRSFDFLSFWNFGSILFYEAP